VALGTGTVTVAPEASTSATVSVTSPPTAGSGYYTVDVSATDPTNATRSAATSATYVIPPSMDVSVQTDRPSYRANQTVTITTAVSANGVPVAGASVSVTIARPNGSTTSLSATTDSTGGAIVKYRLKRQDPTGRYQATSTATGSGSAGKGATSFAVE
jgi:uncharacterized protein YfaS (alpha-2-macroglobulin family)